MDIRGLGRGGVVCEVQYRFRARTLRTGAVKNLLCHQLPL